MLLEPVSRGAMGVELHPWQASALGAWNRAKRQGIIEAVTGSGKTYVAFGALAELQNEDRRLNTLIVVPTVPLMNQWVSKLSELFPERRVGRIGGGFSDDFSRFPFACVAVINSAVRHVHRLLQHTIHGPVKSFLIADECHHYIDAPVFRQIRSFPFHYTLGLSATIDPYEVCGLGKVIFEYGFGDANRDDLVKVLFDIKVPAKNSAWVRPLMKRICSVLNQYNLLDRAAFMSPEPAILDVIAEMNDLPEITVVHDQELPPGIIIHPKKFSTVQKAINRHLSYASIGRPVATLFGYSTYRKILQYDLKLATIHNFQKKTPTFEGVIAWTIDKEDEMRDLIKLGVIGILTNRPDTLSRVVTSWK